MPRSSRRKQVIGQGDDFEKSLAGPKRGMPGGGEAVTGRKATRPVPYIYQPSPAKPGYISLSEGTKIHEDPHEGFQGFQPFVPSSDMKMELEVREKAKRSQDNLLSLENQLHSMFLVWAIKKEKKYESEEEQEKRFKIWCSTKEDIDQHYSHEPGYTFSIEYMNFYADMTLSEKMKNQGGSNLVEGGDPFDGRPPPSVLQLLKTKEESEEMEKVRIEFDKWAAKHKKKCGSSKEREKRFMAYLDNKKKNDNTHKYVWECDPVPKKSEVAPGNLRVASPGQERDMGKQLALEIGDQVNQLAQEKKMPGSGEMVHEGSRSDDLLHKMFDEWAKEYTRKYASDLQREKRFKIWCSTKKYIDQRYSHEPDYVFSISDLNLFADMTPLERTEMKGGHRFGRDPFKGRLPRLPETEEGVEEVKITRLEFNEWAKRHKRHYDTEEENEKKFRAYWVNKRRIGTYEKSNPGCWEYGYDFENMDKFWWECPLIPMSSSKEEGSKHVAPCKGISDNVGNESEWVPCLSNGKMPILSL